MKKLNTGAQLRIGLFIISLLTVLLGLIAWWHGGILWRQTQGLYEHPLTVRRALGELKADILVMHRGMKDLVLTEDDKVRAMTMILIDQHQADAMNQIAIIREAYLGPASDVDSVHIDFVKWNSMRAETIRILNEGRTREAANRTVISGPAGQHVEKLMDHIKKISDFALQRSDHFYKEAQNTSNSLFIQLLVLVLVIVVISLLVSIFLVRSIRKPLFALTTAAEDFARGNLDARCNYASGNEFGKLSESFNALASGIQKEIRERETLSALTVKMIRQEELAGFTRTVLHELISIGKAQAGGFFLLDEGNQYLCCDSFGLDPERLRPIPATEGSGLFGKVLYSGTTERLTGIPEDTPFLFSTLSGSFVPREIVTIPIGQAGSFPAVITLVALHPLEESFIDLIGQALPLVTARLNALLAVQKIRDYSSMLDVQNRELEFQKEELKRQSHEMKQQNTELEMQKQQLQEASRLKTSFLSNMSHELRTPLNSVIALSGVLNRRLKEKIPPDEFSYLEVIERNGKLLLSLINDILDLARIESGKEEMEVVKFNIRSLLDDIGQTLQPQASQKNIRLTWKVEDDLAEFETDEKKFRQILMNLAGNAIKFTDFGEVSVSAEKAARTLLVRVSDTGIGISEKNLPHIFDEFRQADDSTARRFGGTGLGLSIARKYAQLLGGELTVVSKEGEGSTFTLELPLIPPPSAMMPPLPFTAVQVSNAVTGFIKSGQGSGTVLLVDDSEPAIIQLKDFLSEGGFGVLEAKTGEEALLLLENHKPDAIILDLMLPGIDGFQLLKMVRENERTFHLPVLILTAKHITREELSFLKRNNIHQLIQKGDVNRSELLHAINRMVRHGHREEKGKDIPVKPKDGPLPLVLIVEDNPDNMLTLRALLEDQFRIADAVDGQSGVEMALRLKPDIILMDIALPGMNGIDAMHAIRRNEETGYIPVIAVTASAFSGDQDMIVAEGFDGYVTKPVDHNLLIDLIRQCLSI